MPIPNCVVIIPDGNRRAAEERGRPKKYAHYRGLANADRIINAAFNRGTRHVVFWGASRDNLRKRPDEVPTIMKLFKMDLEKRKKSEERVALRVRGAYKPFTADSCIVEMAEEAERRTSCYQARQLTILFGYDGDCEGNAALEALLASKDDPTWENLAKHSWTGHLPDIDMVIRTGAEEGPRLSGLFLPFKLRNTFFRFDRKFWPDFALKDLDDAYDAYHLYAATQRNGA